MKQLRYFLLIAPLILCGCFKNKVPSIGSIQAEIIEYKIEYLDERAGGIPTNVLPGKMTVIFANHYAVNHIEGFLGQFSLSYIANLKTKKVISLLKLFDKKYYYEGRPGELPCGIDKMPEIVTVKTGNQKDIAGLISDEIRVQLQNGDTLMIYTSYFDKIKNPNITTPYSEIEEVLMEFYVTLSVLKMKLSAVRYYTKEIEWNIFRIPDEYKEISRTGMESIIEELFR